MKLQVGKLYSCKDYFLLLFPDREAAAAALEAGPPAAAGFAAAAEAAAAYWSRKLGKPVSYCDPETPLLVLNTENEYAEVLAGDRKGWIINKKQLEIEEISCP